MPSSSIPRRLLVLAWPLMLMGSIGSLGTMIARYWFSEKLGAEGLAVHTVTAQVAAWIGLVFAGIATGCSVCVARSVGARDGQGRTLIVSALALVGMAWVIVATAVVLLAPHLAPHLGKGSVPAAAIEQYLVWWCGVAMPALGVTMVIGSAASGAGLTSFALWESIVSIVVMFFALPQFLDLGLGYRAPAVAALCAAVINTAQLWWRLRLVATERHLGVAADLSAAFSVKTWRSMLDIGLPTQLARATAWFVMIAVIANLATAGQATLGGYGVAMAIFDIVGSTVGGFTQSTKIMMAQSLGANDPAQARRIYKTALVMTFIIPALCSLLFVGLGHALIGLYTDVPAVQEAGTHILKLLSIVLFLGAFWQLQLQAFTAAKATKRVLLLTIAAQALAFGVLNLWSGDQVTGAIVTIGSMFGIADVFYLLLSIPVLWRGVLVVQKSSDPQAAV